MHGPTVLSLGSINVDFRAGVADWPSPCQSVRARDVTAASGGRAANVAAIARRLDVACTLLGRVGDDRFADIALEPLARNGVDVACVIRVAASRTGAGVVLVGPHGDKTMVFADYANVDSRDEDVRAIEAVVRNAGSRCVLVADLDVPFDVVTAIADACRRRGIHVVLDPSRPETMRDELYPLCDAVTPDAHEASALTGVAIASPADALRAARELCNRGARRAFVKLAHGGSVVVDRTEVLHVMPPEVAAVDKTGAGDAFAGALACAMLEGQPTRDAARFAVAAAAIAVTREGTQASYPDRRELDAMLPSVQVARVA